MISTFIIMHRGYPGECDIFVLKELTIQGGKIIKHLNQYANMLSNLRMCGKQRRESDDC